MTSPADAQHQPFPDPTQVPPTPPGPRVDYDDVRPPRTGDPEHGPSLPRRHPAETGTAVAGALVGLAGKVWDLDGDTMGYLLVLVGALPAGITWAVDRWRGV